jgi:hypothetical protein
MDEFSRNNCLVTAVIRVRLMDLFGSWNVRGAKLCGCGWNGDGPKGKQVTRCGVSEVNITLSSCHEKRSE